MTCSGPRTRTRSLRNHPELFQLRGNFWKTIGALYPPLGRPVISRE